MTSLVWKKFGTFFGQNLISLFFIGGTFRVLFVSRFPKWAQKPNRTFWKYFILYLAFKIKYILQNSSLQYKETFKRLVWISEFNQTHLFERGWTARNLIARQSFARHFWQQINCSTQNLSTAQIQLILAKPDSSKWQKKCQLLDNVEQLTLLSNVTYILKKSIFYL